MHVFHLFAFIAIAALQIGCKNEQHASSERSAALRAGPEPVHLTDENFEREVLQSEQPVLVDAWAKWCQSCVRFKPTLRQVAAEFAGAIKVGELDVDANTFVAEKYDIHRYPTLILFVDGQEAERVVGVPTHEELADLLRRFAGPVSPP